MKGNIYANGKCRCGGGYMHDENNDGCFCQKCGQQARRGFRARFGKEVLVRFEKYKDARDFLNGLRWKEREGSFDPRDYKGNHPLGFKSQATKWLEFKKVDCKSHNTYRNIKRDINKAIQVWDQQNIKSIGYGDIEDFLYGLKKKNGDPVSDKTRSNTKSVLHDFWAWVVKRERQNGKQLIEMPDFPECKFVLGWRNIIDIDTQQLILKEVKRLTFDINPKIWIGIKWLCTYISIRPGEMISLKERHINVDGVFLIPDNKENDPKIIPILDEDIELYESMPKTLDRDLYFFRHVKGNGSAKPGQKFGKDLLYNWWKEACKNLNIEGVDLYGGTKHSTTTALGAHFSENELMDHGTTHKSNKAFRRYMQADKSKSLTVYQKAQELTKKNGKVIPLKRFKKCDKGVTP